MSLTVSEWPFLSEEQRTPEQNERWWEECYVPSPADVTLRGIARSVIASGEPGSGKSVALKALERMEMKRLFMIYYPITRWPGEPHAWVSGFNHLGQIMACASMAIKKFLAHHSDKLDKLSPINFEYLRWLTEKYSGQRAFRRWADSLNHPGLLDLLKQPFDDLYPTDTELLDVQGQIEELVTLSQRLGFEGVVVLVDVNEAEITNEAILGKMQDLFGWLTPLQFEGFAIKAAIPGGVVEKAKLIEKSRGRISFTSLRWSAEECYDISNCHLQAATDKHLQSLPQMVSADLLAVLEDKIQTLYGGPTPQAWVWLTETLLGRYVQNTHQLTQADYGDLIHTYFANYVPLKIDKMRQGVFQGVNFISLDEQPFTFLEVLWQHGNRADANQALLEIAGSQGNLNTIASRLRKKIEPFPEKPVYLHNTRSQGYWLENVTAYDRLTLDR